MAKIYQTKTRQKILHCFEKQDRCRTAEEVYVLLQKTGTAPDLSTVYRNLDHLCDQGLLKRQMQADGTYAYQPVKADHSCTRHLHVYCRNCGRLIHLNDKEMKQIQDLLDKNYGFSLDVESSRLIGLCPICLQKEEFK